MVIGNTDQAIVAKFNALRAELADRAFELECQGRCDAADIANELGVRLAQFSRDISGRPAAPSQNPNPDLP